MHNPHKEERQKDRRLSYEKALDPPFVSFSEPWQGAMRSLRQSIPLTKNGFGI